MNPSITKIRRGRSLYVYLFVLKTWFQYYLKTKFQKPFLSESNWKKKKSNFFQIKGKEAKFIFFRLGGIYLKIGQFLSNLFHILPEEFIWELQDLQDKVPPKDFDEIQKRWLEQFPEPISSYFDTFTEESYASASTAQVHIAHYQGKKVAVKVLYPGIEKEARDDLDTIDTILRWFDFWVLPISATEISTQLRDIVEQELDLRNELQCLTRTKELFQNEKDFVFPDPILDLCKRSILVTEFIEGKKIYDFPPESNGNKKNSYLDKLMRAYLLMIFEHRFFHADPHPGNLIFLETGEICFIDFGAVQTLSANDIGFLEKFLISAIKKDYHLMADTLYQMDAVKDSLAKEDLLQILKYSLDKLQQIMQTTKNYRNLGWETLKPMEDLRFLQEIQLSLRSLFRSLKLPPNFLSLHRVLALLLGNFSYLDPHRSIFEYAEKPFSQIVLKGSHLKRKWKEEGEETFSSLFSLPKELYDFFYKFNRGEVVFRTSMDEQQFKKQILLREQMTFGVLAALFFYFGILYSEKGWKEPSMLFFLFSGVSFWSLAKAAWVYQSKK
ncbi:ABC1 family protein [Leptospira ryugenii]|uniref:ABC1 family protein n=1 Tax=Leptospira ryugenii TaxID=1917863 RepID=A0A2P2DX37_9LEPT|nr:AarF/UbiB family protein [Leptospira ryugenii]GBF49140.1 ABC1 family protein [Leptospira ryugenii]